MKIEIDDDKLVNSIVKKLVEEIKPLLSNSREVKNDELLDVKGLAEYLKVKESWVYEKIHTNSIPYHKAGKFPRFRKKQIDKWLENSYSFSNAPLSHSRGRR